MMGDLVGRNLNLEEDMQVKIVSDKSWLVGGAIKEGLVHKKSECKADISKEKEANNEDSFS